MLEPYGAFGWICTSTGEAQLTLTGRHAALPQCNLLFAQLWRGGSNWSLQILFPTESEFYSQYAVVGRALLHLHSC